jgi:hypothetical protein
MAEPAGSESSSSAARARNSRLYRTTGGQDAPSERAVAHPASKLAAIARTTAGRSLELVALHLHGPPHVLDALGGAAGLAGAEENRGDGSRRGEPSQESEHIAKQPPLEEQPHQRSPLRRSSIRAHSMTPMPISVTARSAHLAAS